MTAGQEKRPGMIPHPWPESRMRPRTHHSQQKSHEHDTLVAHSWLGHLIEFAGSYRELHRPPTRRAASKTHHNEFGKHVFICHLATSSCRIHASLCVTVAVILHRNQVLSNPATLRRPHVPPAAGPVPFSCTCAVPGAQRGGAMQGTRTAQGQGPCAATKHTNTLHRYA